MEYVIIAIFVALVALIVENVRIVPQTHQYVIEFLGK